MRWWQGQNRSGRQTAARACSRPRGPVKDGGPWSLGSMQTSVGRRVPWTSLESGPLESIREHWVVFRVDSMGSFLQGKGETEWASRPSKMSPFPAKLFFSPGHQRRGLVGAEIQAPLCSLNSVPVKLLCPTREVNFSQFTQCTKRNFDSFVRPIAPRTHTCKHRYTSSTYTQTHTEAQPYAHNCTNTHVDL